MVGGQERDQVPGNGDRETEDPTVKLRHERFGQSSERSTVLEQLELQLSDLEADAVQAETAAQMGAQPEAE